MHELFGERFATLREPAWHGLGLVLQEEISARDALDRIDGNVEVKLTPNFTEVEGQRIELPSRTIVRYPTVDDAEFVTLGSVGPEYELLSPTVMAEIWDESVRRPIETIGLLRRGALLFITTKLPTIDVKGDEVERYLGVSSPMDGQRSASAEQWHLRVVCANTLKAAQTQARVAYRVVHSEGARERIGNWLREAYTKAEQNHQVVKEVFELLAATRITEQMAQAVFCEVYPDPRLPRENAPEDVMTQRLERWELKRLRVRRRREAAFSLFAGDGTGMNTPAAKGTAWGVFNAVVETADYRAGSRRGGPEAERQRVAESTMFGSRAAEKQACFDVLLSIAQGKFRPVDPSLN